jgi:hypothetical protein
MLKSPSEDATRGKRKAHSLSRKQRASEEKLFNFGIGRKLAYEHRQAKKIAQLETKGSLAILQDKCM